MQPVSPLELFYDVLIGDLCRRHRRDSLMTGRIERLSHRRDRLDPEFPQDTLQLFQREIDTLNEPVRR